MRILKINNQDIFIDEKTAIGITFQAYDFEEPGKRKVTLSNSFTIPLTAQNQKVFGFAGDIQSTDNSIYDSLICNYWNDNEQLITNAKVRIDEVANGRMKLFVVNKDDIWDKLKEYSFADFQQEYADWLITQGEHFLGYDEPTNWYVGSKAFFIATEKNGPNVLIPMYMGNLFEYEPDGEGTGYLETETKIHLSSVPEEVGEEYGNGGHVCTYMKSIFKFLEHKYGVDFLTSDVSDETLLWQDTFAPQIYIPMSNIRIIEDGANPGNGFAWFFNDTQKYPPYETTYLQDKTIYDLVNAYFQLFNVIIDEKDIDGINTIALRRFDDIEDKAPVKNWSGKIDLTKTKFKPTIGGYAQINRIKYAVQNPNATNEFQGAKVINCLNKNLDETNVLFDIDAYYPDFLDTTYGQLVPKLSAEEALSTFCFMLSVGNTSSIIDIYDKGINITSQQLELAQLYSIQGEYNFIEKIAEYPKTYTIEKWLSLSDVIELEFFAQYFIQELGGSFFINKISGFNPELSNRPTKIELIRVSDKTPFPLNPDLDDIYWVDGFGNIYIDGELNGFIV